MIQSSPCNCPLTCVSSLLFALLQYPYPSYFNNATGLTDYYNFDAPVYPNNPFSTYLNRADVKAALHVPANFVYSSGNNTVEEYLLDDWMQSVKPKVQTLLDNIDVLIYNGQVSRAVETAHK